MVNLGEHALQIQVVTAGTGPSHIIVLGEWHLVGWPAISLLPSCRREKLVLSHSEWSGTVH